MVTFNILEPTLIAQEILETTIESISLSAAPTIEEKIDVFSGVEEIANCVVVGDYHLPNLAQNTTLIFHIWKTLTVAIDHT
ncbi:MAG: hypothetical protein KTR27_12330 [Leptolyngbyaceae cyanobacterium MAG.088]|nr:hypothetical protein [Leptolyngbyaceae cyanobacterium MAG.088]